MKNLIFNRFAVWIIAREEEQYGQLEESRRVPHPYHQVEVSPWPILMAWGVYFFAVSLVSWQTHFIVDAFPVTVAYIGLIFFLWWRDIIREAKGGFHTLIVQRGLMIGFYQFLLSEIMIFASFIWAYGHSSLSPAVEQGCQWPPVAIEPINAYAAALLGTAFLLSSGFTVTEAHHAQIKGDLTTTLFRMIPTILLGLGFIALQMNEYYFARYTISDGVYGTVFFMLTGLHGMHVIVGVSFLIVVLIRLMNAQYTTGHHFSLYASIIYWHMVDVVWIVVFILAYIWGGSLS